MMETVNRMYLTTAIVTAFLLLSILLEAGGQENRSQRSISSSRPRLSPSKRFYTTKDLMHSIMNFYSTRKNKSLARGNGVMVRGGRRMGTNDLMTAGKRGLSIMDVKHIAKSTDEEMCQKVCHFCKAKLSMRWAALCTAQCQQGGHEYYACVVIWHAMYNQSQEDAGIGDDFY